MATPDSLRGSFDATYSALSSFDPNTHLITADLKVVKKNSFSTWLGRIFNPQKFNARHVVNNLHRFIQKHGREGVVDKGTTEERTISMGKNAGLSRFLSVLTKNGAAKHQATANKLDKLLHSESKYLDCSLKERNRLSKVEKLKGKIVDIDISKPSRANENTTLISKAMENLNEDDINENHLEASAAKIHAGICVVRGIDEDKSTFAKFNKGQVSLDTAYQAFKERKGLFSYPRDYSEFDKNYLTPGLRAVVNKDGFFRAQ